MENFKERKESGFGMLTTNIYKPTDKLHMKDMVRNCIFVNL